MRCLALRHGKGSRVPGLSTLRASEFIFRAPTIVLR